MLAYTRTGPFVDNGEYTNERVRDEGFGSVGCAFGGCGAGRVCFCAAELWCCMCFFSVFCLCSYPLCSFLVTSSIFVQLTLCSSLMLLCSLIALRTVCSTPANHLISRVCVTWIRRWWISMSRLLRRVWRVRRGRRSVLMGRCIVSVCYKAFVCIQF